MNMNQTEIIAVRIDEASKASGVGRSTLYAEIKRGNLKTRKVGRRTVIAVADLRAWLDSKVTEAA
jgi:excisionase family DNA binding protein